MGRDVDEKMCGKKKFYLSPFRQEAWVVLLLMVEILHHLGCIKPCK